MRIHFSILLTILALAPLSLTAQHATLLRQHKLDIEDVPPSNYSGICRVEGDTYALVSDQEVEDGFYLMTISIDPQTGKVVSARRTDYHSSPSKKLDRWGTSARDLEGIAYRADTNTFFLCGEGDEEVLEYDRTGQPTGRRLDMPESFGVNNIRSNQGIESLTYNPHTHLFWTTTESTLKSDGESSGKGNPGVRNRLRLQSFNDDLSRGKQYAYMMEAPICSDKNKRPSTLSHGVSDLCALDDGRLVVMEREIYVSKHSMHNYVNTRLFIVNPSDSQAVSDSTPLSSQPETTFMEKTELCSFKTKASITRRNLANYEGICLGPRLADGRQTLLLINDTQNGMTRHGIRMKEYIKVIVLDHW